MNKKQCVKWNFVLVLFAILLNVEAKADDAQELNHIKAILPQFETIVNDKMQAANIPGLSIGIVYKDKTVYLKGFGVKTVGESDKVTPKTLFQIGSVSKSFTATLLAMMVDDKKLQWTSPVIDYYPSFKMYDSWVTAQFLIEDLLAHRSGLPSNAGDLQLLFGVDQNHVMHSLQYIKPISSFRTQFAYQNGLILVAAHIITSITGKSWGENVKQRIFNPLNMHDSVTSYKEYLASSNKSSLHQREKGLIKALPTNWSFIDYVDLYGPAGGINSNAVDMVNYLKFQLNNGQFEGKQLVSEENMNFIHSPKTPLQMPPKSPKMYLAEGFLYQEYDPTPVVWHNGETTGARSMLAFSPDKKIGIVILSNLRATNVPNQLAFDFLALYFKKPIPAQTPLIVEEPSPCQQPHSSSLSSLPLSQYVGQYQNKVYGTMTILEKKGQLVAKMGSKDMEMPFRHWNRDVFCLSLPIVDAQEDGFATFKISPEGKVTGVTLDSFNPGEIGFFEKVL